MSQLHVREPRAPGRHRLYTGANLLVDRVVLEPGEHLDLGAPAGDESVVVLQHGTVQWAGRTVSRPSVFEQAAQAVHVPPGAPLVVTADAPSELVVLTTTDGDLAADGAVRCVGPDDVHVNHRGRGSWTRDVHDVVMEDVPAQRLMVGETFNVAGGWSSFPPHKHDGRDGEPRLEEVYYYRFDHPDGFGFQAVYSKDDEPEAFLVRDGDVVGIPQGFHPVCAAPGYRVYYLWALAGDQRRLAVVDDPDHTWLKEATS